MSPNVAISTELNPPLDFYRGGSDSRDEFGLIFSKRNSVENFWNFIVICQVNDAQKRDIIGVRRVLGVFVSL